MAAVTPRRVASAWWGQKSTCSIVLVLTALAALDSAYTLLWIEQRGLVGEINPLIRVLFEAGLGDIWVLGNVLVTFAGAAFLASCIVTLQGQARAYPVLGVSLLAALKMVLGLYHLIQFYDIVEFTWILWITAVIAFLATKELLNKGRLVDLERVSRGVRELRSELSTFLIMTRAPKVRPIAEPNLKPVSIHYAQIPGNRTNNLRNWKLFLWLGVIILAPVFALSVVQLTLQFSGVLDLPQWMRRLGMVSQEQGRLFLVSLFTIFLTIAVLVYSIVAVFEILSGGTPKKKRMRERRANGRPVASMLLGLLLLLVACSSIPATSAARLQVYSTIGTSNRASTGGEVVAAADSKGTIHAAWVESSVRSQRQPVATLWYSEYDPETTIGSKPRLIDNGTSISSLGITIDDLDNTHIIWVRSSLDSSISRNQTKSIEQQPPLTGIYYFVLNPGRMPIGPPSLILSSRVDSLWASIAHGFEDQLIIAWSEVARLSSTELESTAYYMRWGGEDGRTNWNRTLVAKTPGSSKMLKSTSAEDRNSFHLAWIQELIQGLSRVVYSRVDLLRGVATLVNVQDVNGTVSRLTIKTSLNGQLLMGWTYQEQTHRVPFARLAKLSREGLVESIGEVRPKRSAEPESIMIDSEGNLRLVWMDLTDSVVAAPRPIRSGQPNLYYVKFSSVTESSEEQEELSYLPAVTAFFVDNGKLYVISSGGVLEPAKPVHIGNPITVLIALVMCASAVSGFSTEAGTYVLARYASSVPWWSRHLQRQAPPHLERRLLSKIRRHPGITLSNLGSVPEVSALVLALNLFSLEASRMICSFREGATRRFFSLNVPRENLSRVERVRGSILDLVRGRPGITEAEIARCLGLSQQLSNYHLKLLTQARLLSLTRGRGKVSYFIRKPTLAC